MSVAVARQDFLAKPDGLSKPGEKAHEVVVAFLKAQGLESTGGCTAFAEPDAWAARGERYGRGAVLIVVHDGGDHARAFNWDYGDYKSIEALAAALHPHGLYAEQCTGWYSAVYEVEPTVKPKPLPAPPRVDPAVLEEARRMWTEGCEATFARKGDWGSCVIGAGIVHAGPANPPDYIIQSSEVCRAQGSCTWEESVEKVVAFLREKGVACRYYAGVMD